MVLQPERRTAGRRCRLRGGLLPRLFTLTPAGGSFLLRSYALTNIRPLTCSALCVARTFLPPPKRAAIGRTCTAKVRNNSECEPLRPEIFPFGYRAAVRGGFPQRERCRPQMAGSTFSWADMPDYLPKPLPMARKSPAFSAAPPIRPPSTSSLAKISAALAGLHEPP